MAGGRGEKQLVPACEIPCEIPLCPTTCPSAHVARLGVAGPLGGQQRGWAGHTSGAEAPISGRSLATSHQCQKSIVGEAPELLPPWHQTPSSSQCQG